MKSILSRDWCVFAIVTLLSLFAFIAFYPGMVSVDPMLMLEESVTGRFSDWQPPMMAWLWQRLNFYWFGSQSLYVFHLLLFWIALTLFLLSLPFRTLTLISIGILLALFPPIFMQAGMLWKDSGFSICLFLFVGLQLLSLRIEHLVKWIPVWISLVFLFYAASVRHNSFPAILPLLTGFSLCHFPHMSFRKCLGFGFALACLLHVASAFFASAVRFGPSSAIEQNVFTHDLSAISLGAGQLIFPQYILKQRPKLTLTQLKQVYTPEHALHVLTSNVLPTTTQRAELSELRKTWLDAIWRFPNFYLKHRWEIFCGLQRIGHDSTYATWRKSIVPHAELYQFTPTPLYPRALQYIRFFDGTFLYKGWFYLLGSFILGASGLVLLDRKKQRRLIATSLALSSGLYSVGYFFYASAWDLRFLFWSILSIVIALILRMGPRSWSELGRA